MSLTVVNFIIATTIGTSIGMALRIVLVFSSDAWFRRRLSRASTRVPGRVPLSTTTGDDIRNTSAQRAAGPRETARLDTRGPRPTRLTTMRISNPFHFRIGPRDIAPLPAPPDPAPEAGEPSGAREPAREETAAGPAAMLLSSASGAAAPATNSQSRTNAAGDRELRDSAAVGEPWNEALREHLERDTPGSPHP